MVHKQYFAGESFEWCFTMDDRNVMRPLISGTGKGLQS